MFSGEYDCKEERKENIDKENFALFFKKYCSSSNFNSIRKAAINNGDIYKIDIECFLKKYELK